MRSNPLGNLLLLFNRGRGLRSLATARAFEMCAMSVWSIQQPFRFGALGWSPENQATYKQLIASTSILNRLFCLIPFMRWAGNRKAYEIGALFGTAHCACRAAQSAWCCITNLQHRS